MALNLHDIRKVPAGAGPGDLILKPCTFKRDRIQYDADCGALVVPENRTKSNSRLIALPVKRIHARACHPAEPIFWLAGGPGMSNLQFQPPHWLLARHDVVMVGYRGVDGSVKLTSPEVGRALKGVGGDLLSTRSRENMRNAIAASVRRWQAEGVDLEGYSIPEVVEDLEAARSAFGYARVNLLSQSYGTRVAQVYGDRYPAWIHRSVMLGVNPPGRFVWEPETIDAQLEYYARLYERDLGHPVRRTDLAETMRHVLQNLPKRWLFVPIDPGKVKAVTFALLFHRGTAAMVFDAYLAADRGDLSGLALLSVLSDFVLPPLATWGDLLAKGSSADYDASRDYAVELSSPESVLGSPLSLLFFDGLAGSWPVPPVDGNLRQVHSSDVETLLVSGSVDGSTPAEFATRELLPQLKKGKQVIIAEAGHTHDLWNLQPRATERLLTSFYDTGLGDDSLYTYTPMDFKVSFGFPKLAKLLLGFGAMALAATMGAIPAIALR